MGCERYVKSLDGYTHLVVMLFGVFKHFDFLRELEIGMLAEANKLQHLGIDYMVRRSTLAEANKRLLRASFLVRPTWVYSNGCKSLTCPDSGKRLAKTKGLHRALQCVQSSKSYLKLKTCLKELTGWSNGLSYDKCKEKSSRMF